MNQIAFVDAEIEYKKGQVLDIGALKEDGSQLRGRSASELLTFLKGAEYICGHNILNHDIKYLGDIFRRANIEEIIDTLPLSPLLFPLKPYHALLKDDKLQTDDINNPLSDAEKTRNLFYDEVAAYESLNGCLKEIYFKLLHDQKEFASFFKYIKSRKIKVSTSKSLDTEGLIETYFHEKICGNKYLQPIIDDSPVELAYALALIQTEDKYSIVPPWVMRSYPLVEVILNTLRNAPCHEGCGYCRSNLNIHGELVRYFGYESFRTFDGVPLQEQAVDAAVNNRSLLTIFPTGGGKSMTFQLPALIGGESVRGLTVVISPLQSLMKDQVDNLEKIGLTDAVTINGQLDPIQRADSIERVRDGSASLLYIAPESLRSITIENLLLSRNVIRFVIDEAHCFSAWGHDFRIDYLFIGDFIKTLQLKKGRKESIPVSCFTATARKRVIEDICRYFEDKLDVELELFISHKRRHNLNYAILSKKSDDEKYTAMRDLIDSKGCPTIVYVSRTRAAENLAARLSMDGFLAKHYHGQMENREKADTQNKFIGGEVDVIVATSAFGMGVDKSDVGLVIHYDISDSLENYIQEAGRAGRDEAISADCYVLFSERDLDRHLMQLNQTKLTIKEIQQIWKGIKGLSKMRTSIARTALEIADAAGWDDQIRDLETKVRAAIAALEHSGYVKRGHNRAKVYADSILAKNAQEAIERIKGSGLFSEKQEENAIRIIRKLISSRSRSYVYDDAGESRVDYIADQLGLEQKDVIEAIMLMREGGILADHKDLTAFLEAGGRYKGAKELLSAYCLLENYLFTLLYEDERAYNMKKIREDAEESGCIKVEIADIKKIFTYWKIQKWTRHTVQNHINRIAVRRIKAPERMREAIDKRQEISRFILEYLYDLYGGEKKKQEEEQKRHEPAVLFSVNELKDAYNKGQVRMTFSNVSLKEIEDALLFLQKIGALKLEGSLMVIYNAMHIERLESDNYKKYKKEDYSQLEKHYESKTQQIHIVGKYASDMIDDYKGALQFVDDYFQMDYNAFLKKHFPKRKDRARISKTITEGKFTEIFGGLSAAQLRIVNDSNSPYIVVAAGPGSGKTKLLVHKLAALMIMEDVRAEQLLMVTFSRAAATEFKQKLGKLIGTAANYVDIKTFHSYCFDLLGKVGSLEKSNAIVKEATEKIKSGQASLNRITKTAMVIDEAQDMDLAEYEFVKAMIDQNEGMRVIAVGDDDQNIFEFRGSSSEYMERFINDYGAKFYELTENYRSKANIVEFSNTFVKYLSHRLKKADINAYRKEGGGIRIYQYMNTSLIQPLVEHICEDSPKTNTAVLTEVNDDAQMIAGFLNDKGISARLIQSNEGFNLTNLLEIRFFMERIRIYDEPHAISKEVWEEGKNALEERFEKSADYSVCLNLLKAFEKNYPNTKYKSDFDVFIKESNLEDFFSRQKGTVTVSTIHKAKGREFDKVYLMLKNGVGRSDESRRKIYVALTRAKNDLTIFCNGNFFEKFVSAGVKYKKVEETYPEPTEFIVQLAFKDAYLNQFFTCQKSIDRLSSGMTLQVDDIGCYDRDNNMVLRFSRRFFGEMERIRAKNFYPTAAKIRHIVYWKKDGIDREIKILLVDVFFKLRFH